MQVRRRAGRSYTCRAEEGTGELGQSGDLERWEIQRASGGWMENQRPRV